MTTNQPMPVTGTGIAVALAVVVALGFIFFGAGIFTPFSSPEETTPLMGGPGDTNNQPTELMVTDTVVGTGAEAVPGATVSVHYVGRFADGQVFDESTSRGAPITFVLGTGQVIQGWEQGIAGMKVGGKRSLVIPPELGYGPNDYGPIPGGSTLYFDVELVEVR